MNYMAFYLLIGFLAYFPIARSSGVKFDKIPWHGILLAWTIWAIIWLPVLLHAILLAKKEVNK